MEKSWWWVFLGVVIAALVLFALFGDALYSPAALYRRAQSASPRRAATLYARLAEKLPQIEEYACLWAAEASMPDLDGLRMLESVAAFRPQSPAAYRAHIALARHYAARDAPEAEDAYRAALALQETVALRLELAYFLEEQGNLADAYIEYKDILGERPDAFVGMRRTGPVPLTVAKDLNAAFYFSDAVEVLRTAAVPEALPVRAEALSGLGRYEEAVVDYQAWLDIYPDDTAAQMGLAKAAARLGDVSQALELYEALDTPDSRLARAELLEADDPETALDLYLESPYPVAWWNATTLLEAQRRLTETLPLYARLAETDSYLADDAAYRLYVLGERLDKKRVQAQGRTLLDALGPSWLALHVEDVPLMLTDAPPVPPAGGDILEKVEALTQIGREDLVDQELVFALRFRRAPVVKAAMALALVARGEVLEAQQMAARYLETHTRAPLSFWQLSYPRPYTETVLAEAARFDLDPLLIWAVMRQESLFDPEAVSYVGARGLMQVMPTTQAWIAEQLGEDIVPGDAFIPEVNIHMGAWFLRFLLDYFDGDLVLAVAAYNGGAASVDMWQADPLVANRDDLLRWIGFGETREYLEVVLLNYRIYQALYAGDSS